MHYQLSFQHMCIQSPVSYKIHFTYLKRARHFSRFLASSSSETKWTGGVKNATEVASIACLWSFSALSCLTIYFHQTLQRPSQALVPSGLYRVAGRVITPLAYLMATEPHLCLLRFCRDEDMGLEPEQRVGGGRDLHADSTSTSQDHGGAGLHIADGFDNLLGIDGDGPKTFFLFVLIGSVVVANGDFALQPQTSLDII
ncbi:hypothetical protein PG997_007996 [Apiospora hydei]|uniref:Amino acid transporter transmembrane domain-containing protein n=1 Tax=Apiospora hydei TaxID=1337664 RepID=A0ABR1WDI2_9PEZI